VNGKNEREFEGDVQNRRKVMLMAHHVKKPEVAVRFTNQLQGRRVVE
jgi:hypothetical protein